MTAPQHESRPQLVAYLHFRAGDAGPFQTRRVPVRVTPVPRAGQTASGYGARLPTRYLVRLDGRWHRVRVACWSNAGTAYIGRPGAWIATVQTVEEAPTP